MANKNLTNAKKAKNDEFILNFQIFKKKLSLILSMTQILLKVRWCIVTATTRLKAISSATSS